MKLALYFLLYKSLKSIKFKKILDILNYTYIPLLHNGWNKDCFKQLLSLYQVARKYCGNIGLIIIYWLIIGILDFNNRLISSQDHDKIYYFTISNWYWVNIENVWKNVYFNSASLVYLKKSYCWKLCYSRETQSNLEFKNFLNED